ncbi:MAG: DUF4177 domain-containing protein [Saprospiraceae bacterium]|nr:DUF4177 domain-containing protein [Saprospiraceae bacterium]
MKKYKLETAIFYSKITSDKDHLVKSSEVELQGILDRRSEEGWTLSSTDAVSFGSAVYFYLYFERNA